MRRVWCSTQLCCLHSVALSASARRSYAAHMRYLLARLRPALLRRQAMEALVDDGLAKHIGVSNFSLRQVRRVRPGAGGTSASRAGGLGKSYYEFLGFVAWLCRAWGCCWGVLAPCLRVPMVGLVHAKRSVAWVIIPTCQLQLASAAGCELQRSCRLGARCTPLRMPANPLPHIFPCVLQTSTTLARPDHSGRLRRC